MKLSREERDSALWMKLEAHVKGRLELMRVQNDNRMDQAETERLRGRIAFAKELLALSEDEPALGDADLRA